MAVAVREGSDIVIFSFVINNPKNLPLDEAYAYNAKWLSRLKGKTVKFGENVTFLCGPNGSGKSALLSTIANAYHCYERGVPVLTQNSIMSVAPYNPIGEIIWGDKAKDVSVYDGISFDTDGSLVFSVRGGMLDSYFAKTDVSLGKIIRSVDRRSSGESTARDFFALLDSFRHAGGIKDLEAFDGRWRERANDSLYAYKTKRRKKIKPTILFDEAEANLDIPSQIFFLKILFEQVASWSQVVIASHSPLVFSLLPENATVIETKRGYFSAAKKALRSIGLGL